MTPTAPRTWLLSEQERKPWYPPDSPLATRVKPENECSFVGEILTRVIEAEPVLDLLERVWRTVDSRGLGLAATVALDEVDTLLRESGRLA